MTKEVWSGQLWRPITSAFLHGGFFHIALNAINFLFAVMAVRVVFAGRGWLTIFLVSAYVGCLITILLTPAAVLVGASVGLMGLLGALVAGELRLKLTSAGMRPADRLIELKSLLFWLTLNLVLEHLIPNVGHIAHAAGLAVGFLVGLFLPLNGSQFLVASRSDLLAVQSTTTIKRDGKKVIGEIKYTLADDFDPARDYLALVQCELRKPMQLSVYGLAGSGDAAFRAVEENEHVVVASRYKVVGWPKISAEEEARLEAEADRKLVRKPIWWRLASLLPLAWIWNYFFQSWAGDLTMNKADLDWLHFLPAPLAEPVISLFSILGGLLVSGSIAYLLFSLLESWAWGFYLGAFKAAGKKGSDGAEEDEQ